MIKIILFTLFLFSSMPLLAMEYLLDNNLPIFLVIIAIIVLLNTKKRDIKLFKYTVLIIISFIISYILEKKLTYSGGMFSVINMDIYYVLFIIFCIISDILLFLFIINCFNSKEEQEITKEEKK